MKNLKIYSIIILISFFLTFVLFEIYLRKNEDILLKLRSYLPDTKIFKKLYIENYSLRKKFKIGDKNYYLFNEPVKINVYKSDQKYGAQKYNYFNQGFCNKNPDILNSKIIAVGDSFTHCLAIKPEDVWVKNIFNINKNKVLNYGIQGAGVDTYYHVLKNKLTSNIDLIIFAVYEGNDFRDLLNYRNIYLNEKKIKSFLNSETMNFQFKNEIKGKSKFLKKFFGNSYSFNFIWAYIKKIYPELSAEYNFRYQVISNDRQIKFNIANSDIDEVQYAELLVNEDDKFFYKNLLYSAINENFINAKELARLNNSQLLFIYLPSAYSSFGFEKTIFEDNSVKNIVFEYSKIFSSIFSDVCIDNNFDCINLKKELIQFNSSSSIPSHFPHNLHLTPYGSKIVSKKLNDYICENFFNEKTFIKHNCEYNSK